MPMHPSAYRLSGPCGIAQYPEIQEQRYYQEYRPQQHHEELHDPGVDMPGIFIEALVEENGSAPILKPV